MSGRIAIAPVPQEWTGWGGLRLAGDRWAPGTSSPSEPAGRVEGRGDVVMLHGGGQTRHSWDRAAVRLAAAGWTVTSYDARGHGDSAWDAERRYSSEPMVADLLAVIASLETRPVLIGASMGGMTALAAVGENPGIARALVLVDIAIRAREEGVERITGFMRSHLDGFATLEDAAEAVEAYNPHRRRARNLEGLKKNLRLREGRWYWHWDPAFMGATTPEVREVRQQRLEAAAAQVRVPTLVVRGKQSDVVHPEEVEHLRELIPGLEVQEASAGHMVAGDDNDVFVGEVDAFLARRLG